MTRVTERALRAVVIASRNVTFGSNESGARIAFVCPKRGVHSVIDPFWAHRFLTSLRSGRQVHQVVRRGRRHGIEAPALGLPPSLTPRKAGPRLHLQQEYFAVYLAEYLLGGNGSNRFFSL